MQDDIRCLRRDRQLRLRDLAQELGVAQGKLSRWERGLEKPDQNEIRQLAQALGVSVRRIQQGIRSARSAVPGEGYTTAKRADGAVTARRVDVPGDSRRVFDLFCGAGGFSYGFEQVDGFVTACGIDLLPDRIETFTANHEHAVGLAGDIREFSIRSLQKHAGHVDVLLGGPPCQGFSSIRPFRTLTEGDPRNSLIEHFVLLVGKLRPKWFVFENVVGILTHQNGTRLQALLEGLKALKYTIDWKIINAAMYGVPQHRERIVVVGNRAGVEFHWPQPTHRVVDHRSMAGGRSERISTPPLFSAGLPGAVTLSDAIGDLPPVESGQSADTYEGRRAVTAFQKLMRKASRRLTLHRSTRHSEKMLEIIRHAGANINCLPPGMVSSGFSSCYSRLDADRPSTTLTVNFVHPASNRCIHPTQDRALTPREGARIQSFPDRFGFSGNASQVVKQIGNAVPPFLGARIAEAILESEERDQRNSSAVRRSRQSKRPPRSTKRASSS